MQAIETRKTERTPVTTYHEETHKGTLYRITSVYLGKTDLATALEDLTVRKILQMENSAMQSAR